MTFWKLILRLLVQITILLFSLKIKVFVFLSIILLFHSYLYIKIGSTYISEELRLQKGFDYYIYKDIKNILNNYNISS